MKKIWAVVAVVVLGAMLGGCSAGDSADSDENGVEVIIVQTPDDSIWCAKSSSGLSCDW